jgi:hypothetical protein
MGQQTRGFAGTGGTEKNGCFVCHWSPNCSCTLGWDLRLRGGGSIRRSDVASIEQGVDKKPPVLLKLTKLRLELQQSQPKTHPRGAKLFDRLAIKV